MARKLARLVITAVAALAGYHTVFILSAILSAEPSDPVGLHYLILGPTLCGVIGWFIAPYLITAVKRSVDRMVSVLQRIPTPDVVMGSFGLIIGMLIGALATFSLPRHIPFIGAYLPFIVTLLTGYIGAVVAVRKRHDLTTVLTRARPGRGDDAVPTGIARNVLDTSVIIDGRIVDICKTGFIEGGLMVPTFVLEELQHVADSADPLRRNRGRRGLDILAQIQKLPDADVQIISDDFDDVSEVDSKLIRVAQKYQAKILTNDYNLNKVAGLQGLAVLNINELANAVKPVVLPGEEMEVQVIKEGKEFGQGVGYLDDGTMIVVDNGKRFIGRTIHVVVTSVLQTSAGRMIFGKPKDQEHMAEALR